MLIAPDNTYYEMETDLANKLRTQDLEDEPQNTSFLMRASTTTNAMNNRPEDATSSNVISGCIEAGLFSI